MIALAIGLSSFRFDQNGTSLKMGCGTLASIVAKTCVWLLREFRDRLVFDSGAGDSLRWPGFAAFPRISLLPVRCSLTLFMSARVGVWTDVKRVFFLTASLGLMESLLAVACAVCSNRVFEKFLCLTAGNIAGAFFGCEG